MLRRITMLSAQWGRGAAVIAFTIAAVLMVGLGLMLGNPDTSQPPGVAPVAGGSPSLPGSAGGHCGTIVIAAMTLVAYDSPLDAERCFSNAFSGCKYGKLTIVNQGVDTWSTDDLTVSRSAKACRITDNATSDAIGKRHHQTDHCASASAAPGGLTLTGCSDAAGQPWVIPVPSNEPIYVTPQAIPSGTRIVGVARGTGCHEASAFRSNAFPSSEPCPTTQAAFGAYITASRNGNEVARVMADGDGRYRLPLPTGEYQVSAQLPYSSATADTHTVTVRTGTAAEVDIGIDCWYSC